MYEEKFLRQTSRNSSAENNLKVSTDNMADDKEHARPPRATWGVSIEFFLSLLGCVVGPGNVLRFPYLTMRNGGGAFLVPYFICLFLSGIPLFMMEIYMGQSTRKSVLAMWDIFSPLMKGVGWTMMGLCFVYAISNQASMAWSIYYMCASFTTELPWTSCNQTWNTENCVSTTTGIETMVENATAMLLLGNGNGDENSFPSNMSGNYSNASNITPMSAAEEYWQHNVLRLSDSIENIGYPNWKLSLAHLGGLVMIYFCLFRGVRSVGKVIWVTATLPYVLILIFLIRVLLLPGSSDGIKYYLSADMTILLNPETWILAFLQISYTLAISYGTSQTMASYNRRKKNFLTELFIVPIATCLTSFFSGFVIFGCAGFLAQKSGVPVQKAMSSGPGLAFVTYPELTSHLPGGPIWSFLFFLMLVMLIIDSLFVTFEVIISGIVDEFNLSKRQRHILLLSIMLLDLLIGLIFFTNSGMYIFQLIDWYNSVLAMFLVATLEILTIIWVYGYQRMSTDFLSMIGHKPLKWLTIPWLGVILPLILLTAMSWTISKLSKPVYGEYEYPDWCETFGWCVAVVMMLPLIIYPILKIIQSRRGDMRENVKMLLRPNQLQDDEMENMTALSNGI